MADVRLEVWEDHDDIIEVDQQYLLVESTGDLFHKSLQGGQGRMSLKGSTFHFHSPSRVKKAPSLEHRDSVRPASSR